MSAHTVGPLSYNHIFSKIHSNLPTYIKNKDFKMLKDIFNFKSSESIKCYVEAAFRDYILHKICTGGKADLEQIKIIVNICIEGARDDRCLPTLPVFVLSDTFDTIPIKQCEELFEFVESNVSVWKEGLFFGYCKNQVLRMCNDVLRRLSRSQNTIFCGRILLFLARFFPFSERSGLNLISEFNLENVTVFTDTEILDPEVGEGLNADEKPRPSLDYTLYTKFWALQDFFRNPVQCFQKPPWKLFTKYADDILEAFLSFKLDNVQASKTSDGSSKDHIERQISIDQEDQYFPKYLTNQKLLDLQFSDSNFRRYILLQMLILGQYLTSNIKFKQETLNEEQLAWVKKMQESSYALLSETPSNGKEFVAIVKSLLKREEMWSEWKNSGCPEIKQPSRTSKSTNRKLQSTKDASGAVPQQAEATDMEVEPPRKKVKRRLGDMVREAATENKYLMGNAEMTRLWNIYPNNMEACLQNSRDFVPSLENYFMAAFDQVLDESEVKKQKLVNDSNFCWRGLRLLASKSPHFFTISGNSIATLPEYLSNMIKKVATDLPSHVNEDEEEKEEEIGMLEQGDGVKEEEEEEEEENQREESVPISDEEIQLLTKVLTPLGDAWKRLAKKLQFEPDEIEYFVTDGSGVTTMLERWVEDEKEEANKAALKYALEGVDLFDVYDKVFSS